MENKKFYCDGLQFSCQRCSFCCGHSPGFVYLSYKDLMSLCNFFKLSVTDFVKQKCRWADYYHGDKVLSLLEKENYDCVLWDKGCTAYEARPVQCSTYPFWSWMIHDRKTWDECAKDCPGMNKGALRTIEEIERNKKAYDDNTPLKKEEVEKLIRKEQNGT
ncbi:YkgJ family cysteine cluster protein [Treponema parvum]|uniref:YkgJ family cysteine cluster protein n=1 Tax=Treponema parvum TaxID=138851 RepID=A0A975F3E5_9SPIR|nr:YkgJ family cysteine cluster protein [Treponema parvum]QTQ13970.1 YkgJ family cysteine cluster protein [Treponema parvum]